MRIRISLIVAAAVLLGAEQVSASTEDPVLAPLTAHASTKVISFHSRPALLVGAMTVSVAEGVDIDLDCGPCSRYPARVVESEPRSGVRDYSGLNWILRPGLKVKILATDSGSVGRFLVMRVALPIDQNYLVAKSSGCLYAHGKQAKCPSSSHEQNPPTEQSPNSPPPPTTYSETTGGPAHTWSDYVNAGGNEGPMLGTGQTIQVSCKVTGFKVEDGNTWWYRIASSPWSNGFYVTADAFYNTPGQTTGPLQGTPFVDIAVPDC